MSIKFGMMELPNGANVEVICYDPKCTRMIGVDSHCFADTHNNGVLYCRDCGQCERYSRKMAERRKTIQESN